MLSDSRRLGRLGFGAAMVLGPLFMALSALVGSSSETSDDAKYVATVAAHRSAHWWEGFLMLIGSLLLIAAFIGVAHLVRTRKPGLANAGVVLAVAGTTGMMGWAIITYGIDVELAKSPDRAAMSRLYQQAQDSASVAPNVALMFLMLIGVIVLSVGLYRARAVPRWMPALLGVALLGLFVAGDSTAGEVITNVLLIVALGAIGVRALSSSDEQWEHGDLSGQPGAAPAPAPAG